jgi:acyl-CoA synthetase (NDP forming)
MSTVTTQDLGQDFPARAAARLRPLFAPRGIAVIGASRDPAKLGAAMTRSLAGFAGTVAGINPRDADPQAGRYRSVAEAAAMTGAPIDLAILCVPASRSAGALAEAAKAGVRAALVCSGGYAEAGGADRDAIGEVLTALGDLLIANPILETAEINPLRVTGQGLLALDAVVTLRDRAAPREADHRA